MTLTAMATTTSGFIWIDYLVFGMFLLMSVGIGVYHAYKSWSMAEELEETKGNRAATDEYLLGGRKMPILPVALSLLTTFLSGITMLGTPAEIFQRGLLWWIYYLTGGLAFLISAVFFLPIFYKLKTTSIYEYFEHRFQSGLIRQLCAGIFLINTIFYMSVVLYAPAVALSGITAVPTWPYILIIGLTCTLYTTIGGLKAVVWADTLQAFFMYLGVTVLIVKGTIDVGGLGRVWQVALDGKRVADLNRFNPDPAQYNSIWVSTFGALGFWMSLYGLNQMAMQRYCSLPSLRHARIVAAITIPAFIVLGSMACFIGLLVLAYFYNCNPLETGEITTQDQLVILFAIRVLAFMPGLPGLFLATVFSSTLSTISSGMNSMAAVCYEDFIRPYFHMRITNGQTTTVNKVLVLVFGCLATATAFAAGPLGGIIKASISLMGTLAGPLIGLFFLAIFFPKASRPAAIISFFVVAFFTLSLCMWNFTANPYKYNFLPTNSTDSGCQGRNFTVRFQPTDFDTHFGDPQVFWLTRWSTFIYPLLGIVLTFIVAVPFSYVFPSGKEGFSGEIERRFSLTYVGRAAPLVVPSENEDLFYRKKSRPSIIPSPENPVFVSNAKF